MDDSGRSLVGQKQNWEDLATLDPLWAILSDPHRRFGQWDASEFFASGEVEVGRLLQRVAMLGLPANRKRALDFGCGVGRLTRAMSRVFEECYGVDISEGMIDWRGSTITTGRIAGSSSMRPHTSACFRTGIAI